MLIDASGGRVRGRTRFQKLAFLYQHEVERPIARYSYFAWDYGPYSSELQNYLNELARHRFIVEEPVNFSAGGDGRKLYDYRLTPLGEKFLAQNRARFQRASEEIHALASKWADADLDDLVKYVYSRHPEYTSRSKYEF